MTIRVGTRPTVTATITDADGEPSDPDIVIFKLRAPDGTVTDPVTSPDPSITNVTAGIWEFIPPTPVDHAGTWFAHAADPDGLYSPGETSFYVETSRFD